MQNTAYRAVCVRGIIQIEIPVTFQQIRIISLIPFSLVAFIIPLLRNSLRYSSYSTQSAYPFLLRNTKYFRTPCLCLHRVSYSPPCRSFICVFCVWYCLHESSICQACREGFFANYILFSLEEIQSTLVL